MSIEQGVLSTFRLHKIYEKLHDHDLALALTSMVRCVITHSVLTLESSTAFDPIQPGPAGRYCSPRTTQRSISTNTFGVDRLERVGR